MLNNISNFIFDLDGTILNSSDEVLRCFEKAFKAAHYPINVKNLNSDIIGPPLKEIIKLVAPELTNDLIIENIMSNFRKIYDYDEDDISFIYPGVYDLLERLSSSGNKLFIATFKPNIPTMRIIKQFKLDMFKDVYTIDKSGKTVSKSEMITDILLKYNLSKNETAMIGDALSDINAAKQAGVYSVAVLWGYGNDKTALKSNADICIELDDLTKIKNLQGVI